MEHFEPHPADHPEHIAQLYETLAETERYYKQQDPKNITMGYFAEAVRHSLELPFFSDLVNDIYRHRPDITASYVYNRLSRSFQYDALRYCRDYPTSFESSTNFLEQIAAVEQDPERQFSIRYNSVEREIQSNVAERYKSVNLLTGLLSDRFDHKPHVLDVGSSLMHGGLKLVYGSMFDELRFGEIEIVSRIHDTEKLVRNEHLTRLANLALRQTVEFGDVMGIDITDIDDPDVRAWVRACSFYPDELSEDSRVDEYDLLDHMDRDHYRVGFFQGDFSSNHDVNKFRDISPVPFYDVITFSTVFYQVSRNQQTSMIVNALNLLSPNGIIIIQDSPDGNFAKKNNYITSVIDSTDPRLDNHDILRWENGRCKRARLEAGKIGGLTPQELLEQQHS